MLRIVAKTASIVMVLLSTSVTTASALDTTTCVQVTIACIDQCTGTGDQKVMCANGCEALSKVCRASGNASTKNSGNKSTDPTGTPPKGGLTPVDVGGIKDPGGGGSSPTKPIHGLEPISVGGIKQSGDGTGSDTTTIYRTHSKIVDNPDAQDLIWGKTKKVNVGTTGLTDGQTGASGKEKIQTHPEEFAKPINSQPHVVTGQKKSNGETRGVITGQASQKDGSGNRKFDEVFRQMKEKTSVQDTGSSLTRSGSTQSRPHGRHR